MFSILFSFQQYTKFFSRIIILTLFIFLFLILIAIFYSTSEPISPHLRYRVFAVKSTASYSVPRICGNLDA